MAKHYDIYRSATPPDPAFVTLWRDSSATPEVLKLWNGSAWTQAGVQGPEGPPGDQGPTGATGPQGPAGSLASHKATHATGGTDVLTPGDIGAAASSHNHDAAAVTTGVFGTGRLGTGTAAAGKYLDGSGAWTTLPSGSPDASAVSYSPGLDGAVSGRAARDKLKESVSVRDFGAAGLGSTNLGWIASGSPTLNLKDENEDFAVGHRIRVHGAGASGGILATTVSALAGPKVLTLSTNAATTVASSSPGLVEHRTTVDTDAAAGATTLEVNQVWTWKAGQGICVPGGGQSGTVAIYDTTIVSGSTSAGTISISVDNEHIPDTVTASVGATSATNVRAALQTAINANQALYGYAASAPGGTNVLRITALTPGPRNAPTFDFAATGADEDTPVLVQNGRHAKDYFGEITTVTPDSGAPGSAATLAITPAITRNAPTGTAVLRDDTPAFRRALSAPNRRVTLPPVPGGYGLSYESKIAVPPGTAIEGSGYAGRLVRIGSYARDGRMFSTVVQNSAPLSDTPHDVSIRNVHALLDSDAAIAEHTYDIGGVPTGKRQGFWDGIFFVLNNLQTEERVKNLLVSGTVVENAPGPAWHVHNSENANFVNNVVRRPFRGGIILVKDTHRAVVVGNVVEESNDDGIAINAAPDWASGVDCVVTGNFASSATGSHMHAGSAIAIRSCVGTVVSGNRVKGGRTCGIYVQEEEIGIPPRRNTIVGNVVTDSYGEGIRVMTRSSGARGIHITGNQVQNAGTAAIRVESYIEASLVLRGLSITNNVIDGTGATSALSDSKAGIHLQGRSQADANWYSVNVSGNTIIGAWTNAIWLGQVASANLVHVNENLIENCNASNTASTPAIHVGLVNRFSLSGNSLFQPGTNKVNYLLNIACASTAKGLYTRNIGLAADATSGLANNVNGATLTQSQNVT